MTHDIEEIRRRFRRETSKLDNWIYHRRIDEYFAEPQEKDPIREERDDAPEA